MSFFCCNFVPEFELGINFNRILTTKNHNSMKKFFAFAFAALASVAVMANYEPTADEVIILNDVYSASAADAGYSTHAAIAWGGAASSNSKKAGDPNNIGEPTSNNVPCYSTKGNGGGKNIIVSIEGCSKIYVFTEKKGDRVLELRSEAKDGELIGIGDADTYYTEVELDDSKAYNIFLHGVKTSDGKDQDVYAYAILLIKGEPSTDPVLNVAPERLTLEATASDPAPSQTVKFTGKNLAAGTYNLSVPSVEGLSAEPVSVTVAEDGKLNAEITLTYAPKEDVAADVAELSLTIDALRAAVTVSYSASFAKSYLNRSVNIEQWILDNGKKDDAFRALLNEANIEFGNIEKLDSLNDSKPQRNYPYLGQKIKKQGGYIACWLKAGDRISVRFGFVGDKVIGSINGESEEMVPQDNTIEDLIFTAPADCFMKLSTSSNSTVVLKQIMLNEDCQDVTLPPSPEAIDLVGTDGKAVKRIENGMLIIEREDKTFNAIGVEIK